jgi:hypothetical protein
METKILAFAGQKQAGKSTCANFLHGYQLRANGIINGFDILVDGGLVIETIMIDSEGAEQSGKGSLDTTRTDAEFAEWAAYNMWPYVKRYSFASTLKEIAVGLFGLREENIYGNNIQKNQKTHLYWDEMPGVITSAALAKKKDIKKLIDDGVLIYHKAGKITHREFLQFFGTDICRKMYEDIWRTKLIEDVVNESPLLAVVDDCRFPDEIEAIQGAGGKVINLTRNKFTDSHVSESALTGFSGFDIVIDNENLSIHETNVKIIEVLDLWGWLGKDIHPDPIIPHNASEPKPELVGGIHTIKED